MKQIFLLMAILFCVSCGPPRPPKVTWYIDPWKSTWQEYLKDKECCDRLSEAAFPIDDEIRLNPDLAYRYQMRQTYYLDCMSKKGHRVYCEIEKEKDHGEQPTDQNPNRPGFAGAVRQSWSAYISN